MKDKIKFYLTKKEIQLILFIRNKLPFGKGILITHDKEPQRIEDFKPTEIFKDDWQMPKGIDK